MARQVTFDLKVSIKAREIVTNPGSVGGESATLPHPFEYSASWTSGTTDGQCDRIWSATPSLDSTGNSYDLLAGANMLSQLTTVGVNSFVDLCCLAVKNTDTTNDLRVGAGSNPVVGIVLASGDVMVVKPGGLLLWVAPGGIAPVADTGDILKIASSAGTVPAELMVVGRSA